MHVHSFNIAHNDIKLDNVFVMKNTINFPVGGDSLNFVLGDFGLASSADSKCFADIFGNRNLLFQAPEVHYFVEKMSKEMFNL